jgi:hypothetical protein
MKVTARRACPSVGDAFGSIDTRLIRQKAPGDGLQCRQVLNREEA